MRSANIQLIISDNKAIVLINGQVTESFDLYSSSDVERIIDKIKSNVNTIAFG